MAKISMHVIGKGDHVIAFKDKVFLLDYSDLNRMYSPKNQLHVALEQHLGLEGMGDQIKNPHEQWLGQHIMSRRPDILVGTIRDGYLVLNNTDYKHWSGSPLLHKVLRAVNLEGVVYENEEGEYTTMHTFMLEGKVPDALYHGTSSKNAMGILRFGLQPGGAPSNWGKSKFNTFSIEHPDTVFLTEDLETAFFHAKNVVRGGYAPMTEWKQNGFPVIFRFKIPDKSLLIADYDVESASPDQSTNYPNVEKSNDARGRYDPMGYGQFALTKMFGLYGYRGRIPSSFIVDIKIQTEENPTSEYYYSDGDWYSVDEGQLLRAIEYDDPWQAFEEDEEDFDEGEGTEEDKNEAGTSG